MLQFLGVGPPAFFHNNAGIDLAFEHYLLIDISHTTLVPLANLRPGIMNGSLVAPIIALAMHKG